MKLPKIDAPIFEIKLVSVDKPVQYRPFTVKEEKILLVAEEGKDDKDILTAIKQVLNNCLVSKIDVNKLPLFDVEYFFLQLRSKSVSNVTTLKYRDKADNMVRDFEVDLDTIKPTIHPNHSKVVKITDNITIEFKYPSIEMAMKVDRTSANADIDFMAECIDKIYEGDEVFFAENFNKEEKIEFITSLSTKMFDKIIKTFIDTVPTLAHTLEYTNNNGDQRKIVLEGYRSFFP
jgi:hypothetical protein